MPRWHVRGSITRAPQRKRLEVVSATKNQQQVTLTPRTPKTQMICSMSLPNRCTRPPSPFQITEVDELAYRGSVTHTYGILLPSWVQIDILIGSSTFRRCTLFTFFSQWKPHCCCPIGFRFSNSTYPWLRVEGDLGCACRREDIGVSFENDPREHLDEWLVGEDKQYLTQQEERRHLPNLRLHVLRERHWLCHEICNMIISFAAEGRRVMTLLAYLQLGRGRSRTGNLVAMCGNDAVIGSTNGINVKGDEETVQQVVCEHCVERVDLEAEDVVQIVKVVQVLGHEVLQPVQASMAGK